MQSLQGDETPRRPDAGNYPAVPVRGSTRAVRCFPSGNKPIIFRPFLSQSCNVDSNKYRPAPDEFLSCQPSFTKAWNNCISSSDKYKVSLQFPYLGLPFGLPPLFFGLSPVMFSGPISPFDCSVNSSCSWFIHAVLIVICCLPFCHRDSGAAA